MSVGLEAGMDVLKVRGGYQPKACDKSVMIECSLPLPAGNDSRLSVQAHQRTTLTPAHLSVPVPLNLISNGLSFLSLLEIRITALRFPLVLGLKET